MFGNPWDNDPIVSDAPAAPLTPILPRTPQPQTPAQAEKDQLEAEKLREERARGGLTPDKHAGLKGQRTAIGGFLKKVDEIEQLYTSTLKGADKGGILGLGGERNVGGYLPGMARPDNKTFNDAADSLIGAIAQMQGITGGELNSLAEMRARFGPLIPNSSDSDENIRLKLNRLRDIATEEATKLDAQLGAPPPPPAPVKPLGAIEDGPPVVGEGPDKGRAYIDPSGARPNVQVDDGSEVREVVDPALKGLNAQINEMMSQGAGATAFRKLLKERGIPPSQVMPSIMEAIQWRRKHPDYRGGYQVNVETKLERAGAMDRTIADLSFSPGGALGVALGNVATGNRLDNLVELGGGDGEQANLGMAALRKTYPKSSLMGDVVGGLALYGAGRGVMSALGKYGAPATATFAPRAMAGDALMGAYIGSGSGGTDVFSPGNTVVGGLTGLGGGVVGRGAINTTARALSPSGGKLAPFYAEGGKPTIGQRMGGVVDRAEQAFASVPLVGGVQRSARNRAVEQWQAGAFNQALREIGDQLPNGVKSGTAAHAHMQRAFNDAYDNARSGMTFRLDGGFSTDFGAIQREVLSLSDQSQRAFGNKMKEIGNKLQARGGVLSGRDYKVVVSKLDAKVRNLRKNPQGDYELADALENLSIALDQGARRHSAPDAVAALDAADRGYVKAVLIEEAGRRAGGGEFGESTGKQLESSIRGNSGLRSRRALRGDAPLQDYAAAGVRLGDTVGDSGTGERIATMGGIGAVAHFIDPIAASPWIANTLLNLPGGKQAVNLLLSPNRKALDPARTMLMKRAHYGGLLAAPATAATTSP